MSRSYFGPSRNGPLQLWPRSGGPEKPDGPLRFADGPHDIDGLAREAFWYQTPEERRENVRAMVQDAGIEVSRLAPAYWKATGERRDFARAWLNELERVRSHAPASSV